MEKEDQSLIVKCNMIAQPTVPDGQKGLKDHVLPLKNRSCSTISVTTVI